MKTLRDRLGVKRPEVVIRQPKGQQQVAREMRIWTKRGYELESQVPQGRKRIVMTFRLKADSAP